MGHQTGPCDFIDVLEESAVGGTAVVIDLRHGHRFTDVVRDVVTEDGEDFAVFKANGRVPVGDIADARRAQAREPTYEGKLGQ